ncbi:uncharacterized protein I303_104521 [Kwoniella dejecticola CBS 10117]|uniref:F-box domain-containing protein n=1 Tax=Kwoniella dejecticola CBS 10117 TaxID=1296121 RepID=A0A1A6A525_9TREE|nr:uncharacterized protein I303_04502 [Kwoniella dejecticola CBS 10117]OBR85170.1 hypothetical protein I303_04502 [Kwoniella dejecticola CBS 10117]
MDRLDDHLLSIIFELLPVPDIVVCLQVNKHFNKLIRKNARIELSAIGKLHAIPPSKGSDRVHARDEVLAIQGLNDNLINLRPVITTFDYPKNHELYMVWNDYIITRPRATKDDEDEFHKTGKHLVCTLWQDGATRKDVEVPFFTDRRTLAINADQDVLVVKEIEQLDADGEEFEEHLHIFHLFNPTTTPEPYRASSKITDKRLEGGQGEQQIRILPNGKFILQDLDVLRVYDWTAGKQLARYPPANVGCWHSRESWVITSDNLLVAVDVPTIKNKRWQRALAPPPAQFASLAVFDLDAYPPPAGIAWTPDLLLELPVGRKTLPSVVRSTGSVSKHNDRFDLATPPFDKPFLLQSSDPSVIQISIRVQLDNRKREILKIAVPITGLRTLMRDHPKQIFKSKDIDQPEERGVWGNFDNPFGGMERIPFSQWTWLSYVSMSNVLNPQEFQYGWHVISYDLDDLEDNGRLALKIQDYSPYNFVKPKIGSGEQSIVRKYRIEDLTKAQKAKDSVRIGPWRPRGYTPLVCSPVPRSMSGILKIHEKSPSCGSIQYSGIFMLDRYMKGDGPMCFDGKRLIVPTGLGPSSKLRRASILDFGV